MAAQRGRRSLPHPTRHAACLNQAPISSIAPTTARSAGSRPPFLTVGVPTSSGELHTCLRNRSNENC